MTNIATAKVALLRDGDNLFEAAIDNTSQSNSPIVQIQDVQEVYCVQSSFNIC
jgi:hypothetical protein